MSTSLEVWQHVERRVRQRVKNCRQRHARFRKLQGAEAKQAVIEGTVARLMAPDAVFPYALRKRLNPRRVGNITLRNVDPWAWLAWSWAQREYIEQGEFWFEKNKAADNLIDLAVDTERKAYCAATADSGGPSDGKLDTEALENLSRLTEAGDAFAMEPSRDYEQQKQLDAEVAALEYRKQVEAAENAKLKTAIEEYYWSRRCPKQRRALVLICTDLSLTGATIAVKCRISEGTVSKLRANVEDLADQILTIPPEEGASTPEAPDLGVERDAIAEQIAELGEVDAAPGAGMAMRTAAENLNNLMAAFQAPNVDADLPESVLLAYARRKSSGAYMRDNWSGGRRRYSDEALVTGSRYGGKWDDPAKIAEHDGRKHHANKFSDVQFRELQQKAAAADFPLNTFLRAIDSFLTKRDRASVWPFLSESVDNVMARTISGP